MIQVVAGILRQGKRLLICQRHHSDRFPLKWEFPGGKVLPGEPPERALVREIKEELGVEADVGYLVEKMRHAYDAGDVPSRSAGLTSSDEFEILFFAVRGFAGEIKNLAFEAIAWVKPQQLLEYDFLEADLELVRRIASGEVEPFPGRDGSALR